MKKPVLVATVRHDAAKRGAINLDLSFLVPWLGREMAEAFAEALVTRSATQASGSTVAAQLASAINEVIGFVEATESIDIFDAELRRIRLENELLILFARFCEAAIKQMLYCTDLIPSLYERSSLGQLLALYCKECGKAGTPHYTSLLGALAHHFFACKMLEGCLFDHLAFVNGRRNREAAHSDSASPRYATLEQSRAAAKAFLEEVGYELGHMCEHLGSIERMMIAEIQLRIAHHPNAPSPLELTRIPVRPPKVERNQEA